MEILIALFTFASVCLLVIGLTSKAPIAWPDAKAPVAVPEGELDLPFSERVILPFLRKLASFAVRFTPGGATQAVEEKLETAGRPWNMGHREFVGIKVLSVMAGLVIGILILRLGSLTAGARMVGFIAFVVCGLALPDYLLESAIRKRQTAIRKVLADTLDLLTVCVGAGIGLDGAMQKVVEKLKSPFSDEISRALDQMRVGKLRTDALKEMAKRIKLPEVSAFVAAICQADQLGVSISRVLHVQCETLRNVRTQRARETAAKLPVKLLIPLVFFIFPAIFVVVIGPGVIQIIEAFGMMD